jgi:hypothetical protein
MEIDGRCEAPRILPTTVTPAKAGVQSEMESVTDKGLDSGFRRNDDVELIVNSSQPLPRRILSSLLSQRRQLA